jgi:3,4-dihydroxy 2-butanone 4-phosphate synthase/GTP cyclohydrolase II
MSNGGAQHIRLDGVVRAVAEMAAGRPVVLLGDGPGAHGRLVLAAETASPETMAFLIRHTTGLVCVAMHGPDLDRLGIPPMVATRGDRGADAFAVSVDAREGTTTGISATDRARTVRVLADAASRASDLDRPGHVVPVRVHAAGVLGHATAAEGAADLARMAGRRPVGVVADLVADDGPLLGAVESRAFADRYGLTLVSVAQLVAHRRRIEPLVVRRGIATMPTRHGDLPTVTYVDGAGGADAALALVSGLGPDDRFPAGADVVVALHRECLAGDLFGSHLCDCQTRLDRSLHAVAAGPRGVLLHLRGGSVGHGRLAETELDVAASVLRDLEVTSARLLTREPAVLGGLRFRGINIAAPPAGTVLPALEPAGQA